MKRVGDPEDVVRQSGLEGGDAAEFPALEGATYDALAEVSLSATYRHLIGEIDDPAVASVKAGVSLFTTEVKGVHGEITVSRGSDERVG